MPKGIPSKKCGSKLRNKNRYCTRPAGWGTDHNGIGHCKLHGGRSRQGRVYAVRLAAKEASLAAGVDIAPDDFLHKSLSLINAEVEFCQDRIMDMEDKEVDPLTDTGWAMWVRVRDDALKRGSHFAQQAITTGLDKRRTEVAEELGHLMSALIQAVLGDLSLSKRQQSEVPRILEARLSNIGALMPGAEKK